jgi:hypothetical protein
MAVQIAEPALTGGVVGLDLVLRDFVTLSAGEKDERPQYDRKAPRKRRRLAKSIGDAGWSQFVTLLKNKEAWYGFWVKKGSRWYASTKTCPNCGRIVDPLPMTVRQWHCSYCSNVHDSDVNCRRQHQDSSTASMRRDYRGSRGKLRLGTVSETTSRWQCWANQEANLLARFVSHKYQIMIIDRISSLQLKNGFCAFYGLMRIFSPINW